MSRVTLNDAKPSAWLANHCVRGHGASECEGDALWVSRPSILFIERRKPVRCSACLGVVAWLIYLALACGDRRILEFAEEAFERLFDC